MLESRSDIALACTLSCLAGFVDAIGFVHLGGLFVSFMSGNSTRLGVNLEAGEWHKALETAGLIALFVAGAALGNLIVLSRPVRQRSWVLLVEGILLAVAAGLYRAGYPSVTISLIVLAMGLENAVFFTSGAGGVGLTYITGALVRVGQRLALTLRGGAVFGWLPSFLQWVSLISGSVLGAIAYRAFNLDAVWFAAAVSFALCAVVAYPGRGKTAAR